MSNSDVGKTYQEPAGELKIAYEADVVVVGGGPGGHSVVVGGGPGGHSAAVAAARNGAKTVLLERYGHLGGMATGGIVILIPSMSDGGKDPVIAGLALEWLERLDSLEGGVLRPKMKDLGSNDPELVKYWSRFMGNVINGKIQLSASVDPELLKCVLNDMAEDANIKLYLHAWGTRAIVENGAVKGVIFESKSGRQAVLGNIIIDATGDGDLLPSANATFDTYLDPKSRSSMLALVFRIGNCNYQKLCDFRDAQPQKYQELMKGLTEAAGTFLLVAPSPRNDVIWINNWIPGLNCMDVEDLTKLEVKMRQIMRRGYDFMKKNIPTFENSFILDTASQTGTRGGRRLIGEHVFSRDDFDTCRKFEDTIAVFPRMGNPGEKEDAKHIYIPYRALVPEKMEGLLVAGRNFSSDHIANNMANLIPHCIAIGQGAGTAAALAIKHGIRPRQVNCHELQKVLLQQGVPLPGVLPVNTE